MSNAMLSPADFAGTVVAVPPIALDTDMQVNGEANAALARHILAGGVDILLYGGNANLYHYASSAYEQALGMMTALDGRARIVTSIGPDFGKMMEQAPAVERSGIKNVMLLPVAFPADSHGVGAGVRRIAERLGFGVILYLKRDGYVRPETLAELVAEGAVRFVKYAVERPDPADDGYLDDVLAAIGKDLVASGMGETPIADHIRVRALTTYTSGAVCIAPAAAMRLLNLYRGARRSEADAAIQPFLAFEQLRARLGGIQVLHDAVTASGIADMGPLMPMVSNIQSRFMEEVRASATTLVAAEAAARAALAA
jgi:dihydrodipicolinate synthase/N-acetylneuraminate lyase